MTTETAAPAAAPATTADGAVLTPAAGGPQIERNLLAGAQATPEGAAGATGAAPGPTGAAAGATAGATGATAGATGAAEPAKLKPEDYKFKMPEGLDAQDPAIAALAVVASEHGIKPEVAQALIDKVAPEIRNALTQPYQAWKDTQTKWQGEVQSDPEIGGAKLNSVVLPTIAKAMDKYGDPGLRAALEYTGAGNNPAIIRTLYTLSRMVTEGRLVQGNPPMSLKSAAERMYPSHSQTEKPA